MSRFRRFDTADHSPSYYFERNAIFNQPTKALMLNPCFPSFPIIEEELDYSVDLLNFTPTSSLAEFDTITDLIQVNETPFLTSTRRIIRRVGLGSGRILKTLCDRVSDLELDFDRLVRDERKKDRERKYTWTAGIKSPEQERKYKWTAEIKDGKKDEKKSYQWTVEIKSKGGKYSPIERTYTYKVSSDDSGSESGEKKDNNKKKCERGKGKGKSEKHTARVIEIEEPFDHGAIVLRQVFAKRVEKRRGKRTELSVQDAAALIQITFRAHLIRRSQTLRALRELAIAKNKLKEIRALFNNFSYRRRLAHDAEEHQRFSEKIIVLLLTVDAIEGSDLMVRAAKISMVDELEAMLDVVDPQLSGKSLFTRRRTFDMPDGVMNKELAESVAQVVKMLHEEAAGPETFEACL